MHAYLLLCTWRLCIVCTMDGCVFVYVCGRYVLLVYVFLCVAYTYICISVNMYICEYGCVIFYACVFVIHKHVWYVCGIYV